MRDGFLVGEEKIFWAWRESEAVYQDRVGLVVIIDVYN